MKFDLAVTFDVCFLRLYVVGGCLQGHLFILADLSASLVMRFASACFCFCVCSSFCLVCVCVCVLVCASDIALFSLAVFACAFNSFAFCFCLLHVRSILRCFFLLLLPFACAFEFASLLLCFCLLPRRSLLFCFSLCFDFALTCAFLSLRRCFDLALLPHFDLAFFLKAYFAFFWRCVDSCLISSTLTLL